MMDKNTRLERNLMVVEAIAADLKEYLLSDTLFWPLSRPRAGDYVLPKGTLGGLFLRLHRLNAFRDALSDEQQRRLNEATSRVEEELARWGVQAREKATREARSRADSWHAYAAEAADDPRRYRPEYPTQAEGRTALDLLLEFLGGAADEALVGRVASADRTLRAAAEGCDFVWDDWQAPAFPQDRFWWLYVEPRVA